MMYESSGFSVVSRPICSILMLAYPNVQDILSSRSIPTVAVLLTKVMSFLLLGVSLGHFNTAFRKNLCRAYLRLASISLFYGSLWTHFSKAWAWYLVMSAACSVDLDNDTTISTKWEFRLRDICARTNIVHPNYQSYKVSTRRSCRCTGFAITRTITEAYWMVEDLKTSPYYQT
jgi:hypothetical protein